MKGDLLAPGDDVARHCRFSDYHEAENGEIRVNGDAFIPDQEGVSVIWVQFFTGSMEEQLAKVSAVMRATRKFRQSHRLAIVNVGMVAQCGQAHAVELAVEHDPITDPPENPAHCLIKGIPRDDLALRELLALKARGTTF